MVLTAVAMALGVLASDFRGDFLPIPDNYGDIVGPAWTPDSKNTTPPAKAKGLGELDTAMHRWQDVEANVPKGKMNIAGAKPPAKSFEWAKHTPFPTRAPTASPSSSPTFTYSDPLPPPTPFQTMKPHLQYTVADVKGYERVPALVLKKEEELTSYPTPEPTGSPTWTNYPTGVPTSNPTHPSTLSPTPHSTFKPHKQIGQWTNHHLRFKPNGLTTYPTPIPSRSPTSAPPTPAPTRHFDHMTASFGLKLMGVKHFTSSRSASWSTSRPAPQLASPLGTPAISANGNRPL